MMKFNQRALNLRDPRPAEQISCPIWPSLEPGDDCEDDEDNAVCVLLADPDSVFGGLLLLPPAGRKYQHHFLKCDLSLNGQIVTDATSVWLSIDVVLIPQRAMLLRLFGSRHHFLTRRVEMGRTVDDRCSKSAYFDVTDSENLFLTTEKAVCWIKHL